MSLLVKADVKEYIDQLGDTEEHDTLLDTICARVEDTIKLYLNLDFAAYTSATTMVVYGTGTPWLVLPPHQAASVTAVKYGPTASPTTVVSTTYTEDAQGNLYREWGHWYPYRYTVTANWGLGTTWPDSVKEVAVEMAASIFKERDTGYFSDLVGVLGDGGTTVVGYKGAMTKRQKMVLDLVRRRYTQGMFV